LYYLQERDTVMVSFEVVPLQSKTNSKGCDYNH